MTQPKYPSGTLAAIKRAAHISSPPTSGVQYSVTNVTKHKIEPTVFEREDGMSIMKIKDFWVVRAPVKGPTVFWNGRTWTINTLIERTPAGIWPNEFRFSKEAAIALLEDLAVP